MDIVDRIYEAAILPEIWPDALGDVSEEAGAAAAAMVFFGPDGPSGNTHNIPDALAQAFLGSWQDSPAMQWLFEALPTHFTTFKGKVSDQELQTQSTSPFLHAVGLNDGIISMQPLNTGDMLGIWFFNRSGEEYRPRQFDIVNGLRPHFVRSGVISTRLQEERARTIVEAMERAGIAAAVINIRGRVIASNSRIDALSRLLVPTAFGGIAISDRIRNRQFQKFLQRAGAGSDGPCASIPIPGSEESPPLIIHLLPVRGQANDVFSGGHVLMVASPVARKAAPRPEILSGLFDLSPAEARLVGHLASGATLGEITSATGLSITTLRTQMRAVLAKTNVRRQAELMQLLSSI